MNQKQQQEETLTKMNSNQLNKSIDKGNTMKQEPNGKNLTYEITRSELNTLHILKNLVFETSPFCDDAGYIFGEESYEELKKNYKHVLRAFRSIYKQILLDNEIYFDLPMAEELKTAPNLLDLYQESGTEQCYMSIRVPEETVGYFSMPEKTLANPA